jgi:mRNA interferase MazF
MTKRRPAVVISPLLPRRDGLCAVVPLSGSEPRTSLPYVVRIELSEPLPHPYPQAVWWGKCDMIATVGFDRLDLFRTPRDFSGKRKYLHPKLISNDMLHGEQAGS